MARKKTSEKRGRGRPVGTGFHPTQEQRDLVKKLAGYGIPEADIARLVTNPTSKEPISPVTLRKHFRDELDTGHVHATEQVVGALFKNATTGTDTYPGGIPTAQIFFLKCRGKGQWKDRQVLEVETPASDLEEREIDEGIKRLLAKAGAKPQRQARSRRADK